VGWVKDAIERGLFPALPDVIWVLVIAALLFNNGAMLGSATLGMRNLINAQTRTVLNVQVGEVSGTTAFVLGMAQQQDELNRSFKHPAIFSSPVCSMLQVKMSGEF